MKTFRIGVIGQGFMGGIAHPNAIDQANKPLRDSGGEFKFEMLAGRDAAALANNQRKFGYAGTTTDWRSLIDRVDLVIVTTPNGDHHEMVLAAAKAGKTVVCEKPLGATVAQAEEMDAAVKAAGVANMTAFCYRGAPGPLEGRRLIREGYILGNSGYFEGSSEFLQDWGRSGRTNHRYDSRNGREGVITDLGAHQIDLFQWMLGHNIVSVSAHTRCYRGDGESLTMVSGTDPSTENAATDAFDAVGHFANGCTVRLSSNRTSTGHKAYFPTAIHGNRGGVQWELEDQGYLRYYGHAVPTASGLVQEDARIRGWREIHVSNPGKDGHANTDTVPGLLNGYIQYFRWLYYHLGLQLLGKSEAGITVPNFTEALQVQRVCAAIWESGRKGGALVKI